MSRSTGPSRARLEPETEEGMNFRAWVAGRATLLVAIGMLFALVAILIVISLLHPR
jgi:hypothetical protein